MNDYLKMLLFATFGCLTACAVKPRGPFVEESSYTPPDYADMALWAAHPAKHDSADAVASADLPDLQDQSTVDVFFLHPTTYVGKRGERAWNASLPDEKLDLRTDKTTIRYQASIFNGVGRVYAPRYRQAHLESFYTKRKTTDAEKALAVAYQDVLAAFDYYLASENQDRPFIIASHSQGALHGAMLIRDKIEGTPLAERLVAAYLVGIPVKAEFFASTPPCTTAEQTGCFCSWRTVQEGHFPQRFYEPNSGVIATNPLIWSIDDTYAPATLNRGAVLKKFHKGPIDQFIDARSRDGLLMVSRPKIPGVPILPWRDYHVADLNFFYVNVRQNGQQRVEAYFRSKKRNGD